MIFDHGSKLSETVPKLLVLHVFVLSCNQRVPLADPLLLEDVLQLSAEWLLDARQPYVRVQLALQHRRQPHRLQEPFLPNLVLHRNDSQRFQVEKGAAFRTCADDLRMWTYLWPISYFRGRPRPGDAFFAFSFFPIGYSYVTADW